MKNKKWRKAKSIPFPHITKWYD